MIFGDGVFGVADFGLFEHAIAMLAGKVGGDMVLELYFRGFTFCQGVSLMGPGFQLCQPCVEVWAFGADRFEADFNSGQRTQQRFFVAGHKSLNPL